MPGSKAQPAAAEAGGVSKLTYFGGLRSRGEPTQMCIKYGGLNMEVELIDFDEWGKRKSDKIPFMPYITEADGSIVLETENIMKYLAEKGGKFVVDAKQEELCKIANGNPIMLADPHFNMPDPVGFGAPAYDVWFPTAVEQLKDYAVRLGDGPFFAGAKPGYAECFVWHNLDNCFALDKEKFAEAIGADPMAKLQGFYDKFAALDGIKEYLAGRPKVWGMPGSKAQPASVFNFDSGLSDCCTSNPEYYKVVAEIPNARLVEMTMPPGAEDAPHDHPPHSMFVIQGGKVAIKAPPDFAAADAHEAELPTGAPPIMPAGVHQVKNVGDTEIKIIFVEPLPTCTPCGDIADMVTPFSVAPECYSLLAENDDWITGLLTMEPGQMDKLHQHRDHLIYVLEGEEVTIYPDGNMEDGHAVPIKPNAAIPAPMSAGPIFGNHIMKNSGQTTVKMAFFEMKK